MTGKEEIVPQQGRSSQRRADVAFLAVFVLLFGLTIVLWFPGAMSEDSVFQLDQARHGEFSDAHPPLMALLWRVLDGFIPGPLGMLLVSAVLYLGGLTVILRSISPAPTPLTALAVGAIALFPPIFGIIGVIWKDIAMLTAFVSSLALFLLYLEAEEAYRRTFLLAGALLILLYGIGSRHNAAAAASPFLVYYANHLLPGQTRTRRFTLPLFVGALITLLMFAFNQQVTRRLATTHANFWQTLAIYDIAGASFFSNKFLFQPPLYADRTMTSVRVLYSPRSVLPLLWGRQIHESDRGASVAPNFFELQDPNLLRTLARNWREVVLRQPLDYLHHRWAFFRELIGLTSHPPWAAVYLEIVPNDLGIQMSVGPMQFLVFRRLYPRLVNTILFRPYLYVATGVLALVLAFWWRLPNRGLTACLVASGLAHMAGLFFAAVSPDYRYSHWMVFCSVLAVAIVVLDRLGAALQRDSGSALARLTRTDGTTAVSDRSRSMWISLPQTLAGVLVSLANALPGQTNRTSNALKIHDMVRNKAD